MFSSTPPSLSFDQPHQTVTIPRRSRTLFSFSSSRTSVEHIDYDAQIDEIWDFPLSGDKDMFSFNSRLFWLRWTSRVRVRGLFRLKLRNWRNFLNSGGDRSWLGCVKGFPRISNVCLFGGGLGKKMLLILLFIVYEYGRMRLPLGNLYVSSI